MTAYHHAPNYFYNLPHSISIVVIGCGGTGSLVLARLARMDYALRKLNHPGLHVIAYDGDLVEEHNIGRQNFSVDDLYEYKASCLIEKINFSFGLQWEAFNEYVDPTAELKRANIIITCVDNASFRTKLSRNIKSLNKKWFNRDMEENFYWLDTGNGKDFGQCILSTVKEIVQPLSSENSTATLPDVIGYFGKLDKHDNEDVQGMESCSYEESIAKQDLFINDEVAVSACKLIWKLLRKGFITNHGHIINQDSDRAQGIPVRFVEKPKKVKNEKHHANA